MEVALWVVYSLLLLNNAGDISLKYPLQATHSNVYTYREQDIPDLHFVVYVGCVLL